MARSLTVLIAGGTGMIGSALTDELIAGGHEVHILTRSTEAAEAYPTMHLWRPGEAMLDLDAVAASIGSPIDAVINLAGYSISKMPWTSARKTQIMNSRLAATATLTDALAHATVKPAVLINGSAVGFYGTRGDEELTETSAAGTGFLADVVLAWEKAALAAPAGVRVVLARTGLVIGKGGALAPLKLLTSLCAAGPLAGGTDWWPWISLRDEARALAFLLTAEVSGPVNLVAPSPATSGTVIHTLATLMRRPYWLPAPGFAIKLLLGQAGTELLLSSQKVIPTKLVDAGFTFKDPTISQALFIALN
ncbi:MAG: hypothetical protein RIR88_352 [Actinomycetota bacterium]